MKRHSISGVYIFRPNYQKRNLIYYVMIHTIKKGIEKNLETDFNEFILKVVPIIGKNCFLSMKEKTFFEICSVEVNIALLYKHINSKEHKQLENFLIKNSMTYCELCNKELKNDEWREHNISKKHLNIEKRGDCEVCKRKYIISPESKYSSYENICLSARENHNRTQGHLENQDRFNLNFS